MDWTLTPTTVNLIAAVVIGVGITALWINACSDMLGRCWTWMKARTPGIGWISSLGDNPDLVGLHDPRRSSLITRAEVAMVESLAMVRTFSEAEFEKRMAWLRKSGDHMILLGGLPILITVILVFGYAEGYSISWVLGPRLQSNIDQNTMRLIATITGFGIAVVLFLATHQAGALARRARCSAVHHMAWRRAGRRNPDGPPPVTPGMDQHADDDAPQDEQFRARVPTAGGMGLPIAIMATVLLVGLVVTGVRLIDLQNEESLIAAQGASVAIDHLFEALGTTLAMGVLFVLYMSVQVLGFVYGYRHALNSPLSAAVWKEIGYQPTYQGYLRQQRRHMALGIALFGRLQQRQAIPERARGPSLGEVMALIEDERREVETRHETRDLHTRVLHLAVDTEGPRPTTAPRPNGAAP